MMKLNAKPNSITIYLRIILFSISFFAMNTIANAQDCGCTADQVQNNSVSPCEITIGTVDTNSTVAELQNAISQANSSGGNTEFNKICRIS